MPRVEDVLKFRDRGLTVEEARRKMLEAGEAPAGVRTERKKNEAAGFVPPPPGEEFESEINGIPTGRVPSRTPPQAAAAQQAVQAAPPAPVVPVQPAVSVEEPKTERVETNDFVGQIFQHDGNWVAEIQYKHSGAGTERFEARTKSALMLELLRGKGHATIRVQKAVRREKLGSSELDQSYPLPDGLTAEEFGKKTDAEQDLIIDTVALQQVLLFKDAHPEYRERYETKENGRALLGRLNELKKPITLRNLEYVFADLLDDGLLTPKQVAQASAPAPVQPAPTVSAPLAQPVAGDSAPVPAAAPAAPAVAAPAEAPAVVVRRRGTTGMQPGQSSLPSEPDTTEEGAAPREPSVAELRKMPLGELKRIATADRIARAAQR